MKKPQFEYQTYGTTMVLDGDVDVKTHEEIHKRYTSALAESMANTRVNLLRSLIDEATLYSDPNKHQIEVDFD